MMEESTKISTSLLAQEQWSQARQHIPDGSRLLMYSHPLHKMEKPRLFVASRAFAPASNVVLLESNDFSMSGSRVTVCLKAAELIITDQASSIKTVISLWDLVSASTANRNGPSLEIVSVSCANARGGCCAEAQARDRPTFSVTRVTCQEADTDGTRLVEFWASVLQLAALGSLPSPPALSNPTTVLGTTGAYASFLTAHNRTVGLGRPPLRKLMVFINPSAGSGKALDLFDRSARPILLAAGCELDVRVTTRRAQATDELSKMPWAELRTYAGLVAVGGDGSLSELVSGIMSRPDWSRVVSRLAIGVLPGGSGNGLALSLCRAAGLECTFANAALLIAKGLICRMDVASTFVLNDISIANSANTELVSGAEKSAMTIRSPEGHGAATKWGTRRWQFLSTEWAIIADIDLESEVLRCLGAARFDVYGAIRGMFLRKYRGRFSYLPADEEERSGRKWTAASGNESPLNDIMPTGSAHRLSEQVSTVSLSSDLGEEAFPHDIDDKDGGPTALPQLQYLSPFGTPVPLSWQSLEGTFTFLWITNTSHQSAGVAVSPGSRHGDGAMSVTLVRDVGFATMMKVLLSLDETGSLHNVPGVEQFTALAWRLEPEDRGGHVPQVAARADPALRAGRGHVAVDGEAVPYGPIQAELHPGLLRVFGPGAPAEKTNENAV